MTRHYALPAGQIQISFSGGRTSAYMLHEILDANGGLPDRVRVVFSNTGREMPQTLDFVQEISDRWSVPITWVEDAPRDGGPIFRTVSHNSASRNGEPFEALIARKRACPDQSKRFCTEHLKLLPARRLLISLGWKTWTNAVGIRADEAHRATGGKDQRVSRWFPLVDAKRTKDHITAFWAAQPFDLRTPAGLGNCDGCFLKSEATLAALARDHPHRHAWWERMEALASSRSRSSNNARFRDQFTRRDLRMFVERQGDWIFSTDAALCQAEHGECTS